MWSSGIDITLDDVLTILKEHFNNVRAPDVLNQALFQMQMADKETIGLGCPSLQTLTNTSNILPGLISSRSCSGIEEGLILWWTSQMIEGDGVHLKVGPQVRTYSNSLRATREAEKEDSIKLSQNPRIQVSDGLSKPRPTSFFPLRKLRGSQPFPKKPTIQLVQLEEEDTDNGEEPESDDPDGIKGVVEEFMVQLARVVKDAQTDEKGCYHCSSPEHFIHNCPLVKTARDKKQLNGKEGMAMMKGAQTPPTTVSTVKSPQKEAQEV